MIDIHCHILPGIDDGPGNIKDALKMARLAVKDGVRTIIATPHCFDGVYDCQNHDIVSICEEFNIVLYSEKIPLVVLPGAEIRLTPELPTEIEQGRVLTLADSNQAVLLELPEMFIPQSVSRVIWLLRESGLRTIIAHPERNTMILTNNAIINELITAGAEFQLTAGSLLGEFGSPSMKVALQLLHREGQCYIASDGHCIKKRKPLLSKALKVAAKNIGKGRADKLVENKYSVSSEMKVCSI